MAPPGGPPGFESLQILKAVTALLVFFHFSDAGRVYNPEQQRYLFGTVFCDSCLENHFTRNSIAFSGAKLKVQCHQFSTVTTTNKTGEFKLELPGHVNSNSCTVKLLSKPLESCDVPSTSTSHWTATYDKKSGASMFAYNLVFKPTGVFNFCGLMNKELTLGPPDPPQPSVKHTNSYHLGPPDPPRPNTVVSKSYRLGPPNPPQPRVHN